LPPIQHEPVGAHAKKGTEARFLRLIAREPLLLKRVGKERLRRFFGLVFGQMPVQAQVAMQRLPVPVNQVAERLTAGTFVRRPHAIDDRMTRGGKARHRGNRTRLGPNT